MANASDATEVLAVNRPGYTGYRRYRPRYRDNQPRPEPAVGGFRDWWASLWDSDDDDDDKVIENAFTIDLLKTRNRKSHHTKYYETEQLVVRRGQPFSIEMNLKGTEFDPELDQLILEFAAGENPRFNDDTFCSVKVYPNERAIPKEKKETWHAFMTSQSRSEIRADVTIPSTAVVSSYKLTAKLYVQTKDMQTKRYMQRHGEDILVLFNPWCQADQTYLADENERIEYVLRDSGRMYVGDHDRMSPRPWRYGQFDKVCLEAAFYLLDRSSLRKQGHGNATQVCRALTSQLNSKDNDGVLVGNWTGHYPGGVSPTAWNGSVSILQQYMQTKHPVKYGQCWVFSGLMTTVCRALGIPCRSITNFLSGIDRDTSMTIDWYVDENLDPLHDMDESRWNFHVWNEAWFKRPDLPAGYDGWQAMDSCPQDSMISDGVHCCGPAPLRAIKEGNVYLGYDAGFLFAEVNGDQITWLVKRNGDIKPLRKQSRFNYIGRKISTKEVGRNKRNDITNLYKYPEGSDKEREAVERAGSFGSRKAKLLSFYDDDTPDDVRFHLEKTTKQNGDIEIQLNARNESQESRSIELKLTATAAYYTGATGEEVATAKHKAELQPKMSKNVKWTLPAELYLNAIDEDALVKIWVTAKVAQSGQMFFNAETFTIDKPDLIMQLDKPRVRVGETVELTVKFENPLDIRLYPGVMQIEGLGANKNLRIPIRRGIKQGQGIEERIQITPQFPGKTEIIGSLNFRQLTGICGAVEIEVVE